MNGPEGTFFTLSNADGERSGVRPDRLQNAEAVLLNAVEAGIFPGCAVSLEVNGTVVWREGYGTLEPGSPHRVAPETLYDLASLTKPLACAAPLMRRLERGEVCLTDEVRRYFPDSPLPHLKGVTLAHLLTHTSGLPAWERYYERCSSPAEVISSVLSAAPEARPGERYAYSDLGYILLGEILRRATDRRLDDLAREEVFRPLGMETAGYWALDGGGRRFMGVRALPPEEAERRIAPTRFCPLREGRTLCAEVHDGNGCALEGVSGHAGLFGTADDVMAYLRMLLNGGRGPDGEPFFSPAAVRLVTRSQIDPSVGGHTLGWFAPPNGLHAGGDLWRDRGFSHTGFTGTHAFADPDSGVAVVLLTNAVYFSTGEHLRVRRAFMNAVAASLCPS
ncbi:MAG: beta-lactamase family protein [Armatimonadetes bacterium]|nr:beta-lactamase family protein [Armatimonadota bacterium]